MGTVLEMMGKFSKALALSGLVLLSACGSEKDSAPVAKTIAGAVKELAPGKKKAAAAAATASPQINAAALAQYKTPMVLVELPSRQYFNFMVPYGQNGSIETWASSDKKTIAFRDGMVLGTRGFGPDLMQSSGPTLAQIAAASGSHKRIYVLLDGADQSQRFEFDCVLQDQGRTQITVVERQHTVRHIAEQCSGIGGDFTNEYWLENGNFLRKSKQLMNRGWGSLVITRVIDKGRT